LTTFYFAVAIADKQHMQYTDRSSLSLSLSFSFLDECEELRKLKNNNN